MSLREKSIVGISWAGAGQLVQQLFNFGLFIILAHLLSPRVFGLLAMVDIFIRFADKFRDGGFGAALIQYKTVTESHRSSVFWISALIGIIFTTVFAACSPFIAAFYNERILLPLTLFLSLQFIIGSLSSVQKSLLEKNLEFKGMVLVEIFASIVSSAAAVILALKGFGVWSLAWRSLINITLISLGMWWVSSWYPRFLFSLEAVKELWPFSSHLLGFQLLNYWYRQGDDLLIGKFLGSAALGIYSKAYAVMLLPISNIRSVLSRAMFPAMAAIQDDKERTKKLYLKSTRMLGLITVPMMMGLLVTAPEFVLTLFGTKWTGMIPIVQILCLVGVIQPISSTTGWIFKSQGRTDILFKWSSVVAGTTIVSFIVGIFWGITGVAWAYATANYILLYPNIRIPGQLINMNFREFIRNVSGIFIMSLLMGAFVLITKYLMPAEWPVVILLLVETFSGIVIYFILIRLFKIKACNEFISLLKERYKFIDRLV